MKHRVRSLRDWVRRVGMRVRCERLRLSRQTTVTIVNYHQVTDEATRNWGPWRYAVTPRVFETHVSRLASRYDVVTMDDILAYIEDDSRSLPTNTAVVTFDDGYENTLKQAVPILERHGVPATVYISTGLLGTAGPFEFRLAAALMHVDLSSIDSSDFDFLSGPLSDGYRRAYEQLRRPVKWKPPKIRERLLNALKRDTPERASQMLTADQVRTLADRDLITVAAHGHEHVPLTTLSESLLRENIDTTVAQFANVLGKVPRHFSYPYGAHDESVQNAVSEAGFRTAVTTGSRMVHVNQLAAMQFSIPRIDGSVYTV